MQFDFLRVSLEFESQTLLMRPADKNDEGDVLLLKEVTPSCTPAFIVNCVLEGRECLGGVIVWEDDDREDISALNPNFFMG